MGVSSWSTLFERRRVKGLLVAAVIVIGFVGIAAIINTAPRCSYYYEEKLPVSTDMSHIAFLDIVNATITVNFVDEPELWYRMRITHSIPSTTRWKDHRIEFYSDAEIQVKGVRIESIAIFLGTDVAHALVFSGENLHTRVVMDNGAKIAGGWCSFHSTGTFEFIITKNVNVNITTLGLYVTTGGDYWKQELVILDIDLPDGMNGRLFAPNASFLVNEWYSLGQDSWGAGIIDFPLLDIHIYNSESVWAKLLL